MPPLTGGHHETHNALTTNNNSKKAPIKMNILFSVDQKAALLAGINAPHSTALIDIDPAHFSPDERELLVKFIGANGKADKTPGGLHLTILSPDENGVKVALAAEMSRQAQRAAELRVSIERYIANGGNQYVPSDALIPADLLAAYEATRAARETERLARDAESNAERAARIAQIDVRRDAERAEAARRAAIEMAEYDALTARLPAEFAARKAAGYATEDEEHGLVRSLIRSDAGIDDDETVHTASRCYATDSLTPAQFARLNELIQRFPSATVDAVQMGADEEEEEEEDDDAPKYARVHIVRGNISDVSLFAL